MNISRFLEPDVLVFLIPISAIVMGTLVGGVVAVTKLVIRHRERMAMIAQGMNPDARRAPAGDSKAKPEDCQASARSEASRS